VNNVVKNRCSIVLFRSLFNWHAVCICDSHCDSHKDFCEQRNFSFPVIDINERLSPSPQLFMIWHVSRFGN